MLLGRLAIDDIDHDLLGMQGIDRLVPCRQFFGRGIIDSLPVVLALEEAGLQGKIAVEDLQPIHDLLDREVRVHRQVDAPHHLVCSGIEFEDPIIAQPQGLNDIGSAELGRVA